MKWFGDNRPKVEVKVVNEVPVKVDDNPIIETDEMEVVEVTYSNVIEEIHNEFNSAGDKLLANAKKIQAEIKIENEEKMELLDRFQFKKTEDFKTYEELKNRKRSNEGLAEAIQHYMTIYPNYKFITHDIVRKICEKYGLVLGKVRQYKGFVPEKNLREIAKFFELYPKLEHEMRHGTYQEHEAKVDLEICAPLKDMELERNQRVVDGYRLSHPDPVVLYPLHENYWGYLILTAWGDEASDELVVNQKMN